MESRRDASPNSKALQQINLKAVDKPEVKRRTVQDKIDYIRKI